MPVNAAISEIGKCDNLQDAFAVPLARRLFGIDAALRWVLFMTIAPDRAEGDSIFAAGCGFSPQDGLTLISQVYDLGVRDAVLDHFDDESSSEASEGEADPDAHKNV